MERHDQLLPHAAVDFQTDQERVELVQLILGFFDEWEIKVRDQLILLGLREKSRSMLSYYRNGKTPLSPEQDKLDRASLLVLIYRDLFALFPENEALRRRWITSRNTMLNNQTPLEMMTEQGILGMAKVARYLNFQLVH